MREWEKKNAEDIVVAMVGQSLEAMEAAIATLATQVIAQVMLYLEERHPRREGSFAEVIIGLCEIEAGKRIRTKEGQS